MTFPRKQQVVLLSKRSMIITVHLLLKQVQDMLVCSIVLFHFKIIHVLFLSYNFKETNAVDIVIQNGIDYQFDQSFDLIKQQKIGLDIQHWNKNIRDTFVFSIFTCLYLHWFFYHIYRVFLTFTCSIIKATTGIKWCGKQPFSFNAIQMMIGTIQEMQKNKHI